MILTTLAALSGRARAQSVFQDLLLDSTFKRIAGLDLLPQRVPGLQLTLSGDYEFVLQTSLGGKTVQFIDGFTGGIGISYSPENLKDWQLNVSAEDVAYRYNFTDTSLDFNGTGAIDTREVSLQRFLGSGEVGVKFRQEDLNFEGSIPQLNNSFSIFPGVPQFDIGENTTELGVLGSAQLTRRVSIEGVASHLSLNGAAGLTGAAPSPLVYASLPADGQSLQGSVRYSSSTRDCFSLLGFRSQFSGNGAAYREGGVNVGDTAFRGSNSGFGLVYSRRNRANDSFSCWGGSSSSSSDLRLNFPDATVLGLNLPAGSRAYATVNFHQSCNEIGAALTRPKGSGAAWTESLRLARMPVTLDSGYQVAQFLTGVSGTAELDYSSLFAVEPALAYEITRGPVSYSFSIEQVIPFLASTGSSSSSSRATSSGPTRSSIGGAVFSATIKIRL